MKLLTIITLALITNAFSWNTYTNWISMQKSGYESINYQYTRCFYTDYANQFRIQIVIQGSEYSCPYVIQYDPTTGSYK